MRKAVKDFIDKAVPRESDSFWSFWVIDSGKKYDGFFGENGFNNIILIGNPNRYEGKLELITTESDVINVFREALVDNGFGIEIGSDNGIVHIFFDHPIKLFGAPIGAPLSSCIFSEKKEL